MINKNELEKIVISSEAELKAFEGCNLKDKYFILNKTYKNVKLGTLESCVIEGGGIVCEKLLKCNLYGVEYTYVDKIYTSILKTCKTIQCGDIESDNIIKASQFFECEEISVSDAVVEDCIFDNFKILLPTSTTMSNCIVSNVVCDKDCAICMEDGDFKEMLFENIDLRNDSYLVKGFGEPWVENSTFKNIRTSRKDYEIFYMEEAKGKIFKKKIEYNFVDKESCSGLDLIPVFNCINEGVDVNE